MHNTCPHVARPSALRVRNCVTLPGTGEGTPPTADRSSQQQKTENQKKNRSPRSFCRLFLVALVFLANSKVSADRRRLSPSVRSQALSRCLNLVSLPGSELESKSAVCVDHIKSLCLHQQWQPHLLRQGQQQQQQLLQLLLTTWQTLWLSLPPRHHRCRHKVSH